MHMRECATMHMRQMCFCVYRFTRGLTSRVCRGMRARTVAQEVDWEVRTVGMENVEVHPSLHVHMHVPHMRACASILPSFLAREGGTLT